MSELAADGWRLPDDACALLRALVLAERPALVLEAGSGRSTVVLAEALRDAGAGRLVALEHEPRFAAETMTLLAAAGLGDVAEVRAAPLEPHGLALDCERWYAVEAWDDLDGIGLLVVDGPPGGANRFARAPALPLLRSRLAPGCMVVLDDVGRADEAAALASWGLVGVSFLRHEKATLAFGRLLR